MKKTPKYFKLASMKKNRKFISLKVYNKIILIKVMILRGQKTLLKILIFKSYNSIKKSSKRIKKIKKKIKNLATIKNFGK